MTNINLTTVEPQLKDLLDLLTKQIKLDMNCHHIGTIKSFNALTQTAEVSINYTKTFLHLDQVGNQRLDTPNYPILVDCPVIVLNGGGGSLTFPIEAGDECLVLFNDRDLDNWFGTGGVSSAPLTGRLHSFSDAIALVGVRSIPNVELLYGSDHVALKYKTNKIQIFDDKIVLNLNSLVSLVLTNDGDLLVTCGPGTTFAYGANGKLEITNLTTEFVSALDKLFTDVQNGLVTTMLGPQPLVMPSFAVDLLAFQSFKA